MTALALINLLGFEVSRESLLAVHKYCHPVFTFVFVTGAGNGADYSHKVSLQDFVHAKQLFAACLELVTEFSPKLRQVMLNEVLLLDIYTHEAGAGLSGDRPPSDLISRVRGYLEMRVPGKND